MKKLGINGFGGRMGQVIYDIMNERGHELNTAFDVETSSYFGKKTESGIEVVKMSAEYLEGTQAIIDFSFHSATMNLLDYCIETKTPIVIGTTGLDEDNMKKIQESSKTIPVFWSPNMSVGVNLLFKLVEQASKSIPDGYDIEIFEAHHKFKKDSPSGTALKLRDIVKENCSRLSGADTNCSREGIIGERNDNEIGMQVLRGGDIVGEHTVFYTGIGERIEITHRATNRRTFAEGAVTAAEFISDKGPGMYNMDNVLGF